MDKKLDKIYNKDLDVWGLPQRYKEVDFYPILLSDVYTQNLFYKIFQYPKNYIPDKQILKMSYLKYLLYIIQASIDIHASDMQDNLIEILKKITRRNKIEYNTIQIDSNGEDFFDNLIIEIIIDDIRFTEQDFDIIRGIILQQNGLTIEYIEEFDPSLEKLLAFTNRGSLDVTLEDEIIIFATLNNLSIDSIKNYTIYQFKKHFVRSVFLLDYTIYSPLEISGQIKSKSGEKIVKHYMEHMNDKSRYSDILIPQEQMLAKIPGIKDEHGNIMPQGNI
jgi:hypothetical protein